MSSKDKRFWGSLLKLPGGGTRPLAKLDFGEMT